MRRMICLFTLLALAGCKTDSKKNTTPPESQSLMAGIDTLIYQDENYFKSIRQVTFGGDNAEAYWSFDDEKLVFQSNNPAWGLQCDQLFIMGREETFKENKPTLASTGLGRTTCAYFLPDNEHILYGSTHLADALCYDGGAFFSPDGTKIIFRASRPRTEAAILEYEALLSQGLVQPTEMELFICNADGSGLKQLTFLGNANWSPFFHPSGKKVLFSGNFESEKGFPFNLYFIGIEGTNLECVIHGKTFDAFPVFSNNGKYSHFKVTTTTVAPGIPIYSLRNGRNPINSKRDHYLKYLRCYGAKNIGCPLR